MRTKKNVIECVCGPINDFIAETVTFLLLVYITLTLLCIVHTHVYACIHVHVSTQLKKITSREAGVGGWAGTGGSSFNVSQGLNKLKHAACTCTHVDIWHECSFI